MNQAEPETSSNPSDVCTQEHESNTVEFLPTNESSLQLEFNNNFHVIGVNVKKYKVRYSPVFFLQWTSTASYKEWIEDVVWPVQNLLPAQCGEVKVNHNELISLGMPTFPGEFPWHVAINLRESFHVKKYICGGSIITNRVIITGDQ